MNQRVGMTTVAQSPQRRFDPLPPRVDLVVLRCMGFSADHRTTMRDITRRPMLVANAIVARTAAGLLAA